MLYYLPERIYNLVKDSDEFRLISEKVEESFTGVNSLVDAIAWENKLNTKYTRFILDEVDIIKINY